MIIVFDSQKTIVIGVNIFDKAYLVAFPELLNNRALNENVVQGSRISLTHLAYVIVSDMKTMKINISRNSIVGALPQEKLNFIEHFKISNPLIAITIFEKLQHLSDGSNSKKTIRVLRPYGKVFTHVLFYWNIDDTLGYSIGKVEGEVI